MRHGSLFSCKQLGHPALFDLRDMSMSLIVQAEKSVRNVISTVESPVLALEIFFYRTASISQSIPTKVDSCLLRSPCHRNPILSISIRSRSARTQWPFAMLQIRNVRSPCTNGNRHPTFFPPLAILFFDINGKPIGDGKPVSHAVNNLIFHIPISLLSCLVRNHSNRPRSDRFIQ